MLLGLLLGLDHEGPNLDNDLEGITWTTITKSISLIRIYIST